MTAQQTLVIYGNCQAEFIHMILRLCPSLSSRFNLILIGSALPLSESTEPLLQHSETAVLLWEQYNQRDQILLREEIRSRVPTNCFAVRFPAVGLNTLWPLRTKDPRNTPEAGFPWGRYPIGDHVAMNVARLGLRPNEALKQYHRISRERMPNLQKLLQLERAFFKQRDAACDIAMEDFVFSNLTTTRQFWTYGHLDSYVVRHLLSKLIEASKPVLGPVTSETRTELTDACANHPGQGNVQLPIHPTVIERLDLSFVSESSTYRYFGNEWTFDDYITHYMRLSRDW